MANKDTKTAKPVAEPAKETKAAAKTTEAAKAPAKEAVKAPAKKETTAKKATAKKATTKKAEIKTSMFLQFEGKEVSEADILANIKKAWTSQFKGKLKDIKTIDIYLKTEEHKAYFVINGDSNPDYFVEL